MVRFVTSLLALSLSATVLAKSDTITCNTSKQCPEDKPCCSRKFLNPPPHRRTGQISLEQVTDPCPIGRKKQNTVNVALVATAWVAVTLSLPSPWALVHPCPCVKTRATHGTTWTTLP